MALTVVCKSAKCHSCSCLADSYIATSHKHFRSTVAILFLISYIKACSRCLRTADFSIDVRSDYIGHTIEASAKGCCIRASRRTPGVGARNVDFDFTLVTVELRARPHAILAHSCT